MLRNRLPLIGLAVLLAQAPALAQEIVPRDRVRYTLRGEDTQRGAFEGWLILSPIQGSAELEVVRWVRYQRDGYRELHRGFAAPQGTRLEVVLRRDEGFTDTVTGSHPGAPRQTTITFTGPGDLETRATSSEGNSTARGTFSGEAAEAALAPVEPDELPTHPHGLREKLRDTGRHLVIAAREAVDKASHKGLDLNQTFKLTDFFHIALGVEVHVLDPAKSSPEQRRMLLDHPRHLWMVTKAEGGVRIPLTTTIPIGDVSVGVGFVPGARLGYEVTDLYALPDGWNGDQLKAELKRMAKRSFDLPLDAGEALAMTVGAERVFDGDGSVGISGSLAIGHQVADIDGVMQIGASARVGGFYHFQGRFRVEVQRLLGDRTRVRLTTGTTRSKGSDLELFLGAAIDKDALKAREEVEPVVEYIDEALISPLDEAATDAVIGAAANLAKKAVRFRIRAGKSKTARDEVALSYLFDLRRESARRAYEQAVRGDFVSVEHASAQEGSGVVREFRVVEAERSTHMSANVDLSLLLSAAAHKNVSLNDLSVEDQSGRSHYDIFRFTRRRDIDLIFFERRKALVVEVVRKTRPDDPDSPAVRSFHFRMEDMDPATRKAEAERFMRLLAAWGLRGESTLPTPDKRPFRYRKTESHVDVGISEVGLQAVLSASQAELFQAYVDSVTIMDGKAPLWATAEGREEIRRELAHGDKQDKQRYEWQARQYERARRFVGYVQGLAGATTAKERADQLRGLANDDKWDLYALGALVGLARSKAPESLQIEAAMEGKLIQVRDGKIGQEFAYVEVDDPRQ